MALRNLAPLQRKGTSIWTASHGIEIASTRGRHVFHRTSCSLEQLRGRRRHCLQPSTTSGSASKKQPLHYKCGTILTIKLNSLQFDPLIPAPGYRRAILAP